MPALSTRWTGHSRGGGCHPDGPLPIVRPEHSAEGAHLNTLNTVLGSVWTMVAAIVGSCSAIIVSVVGVWNSRRQLHLQLAQQSFEFKLAREMTLRRDVYLEAAVAIARSTHAVNELADAGVSGGELGRQFAADFATIAKVHVVGAPETIEALSRVTLELGDAQASLNLRRASVADLQRALEATPPDAPQRAERQRAWLVARLELAELAMQWATRVAKHAPAAIAAIRRELDLPSRDDYQATFDRTWSRSQQHLLQRIEALRAELQA